MRRRALRQCQRRNSGISWPLFRLHIRTEMDLKAITRYPRADVKTRPRCCAEYSELTSSGGPRWGGGGVLDEVERGDTATPMSHLIDCHLTSRLSSVSASSPPAWQETRRTRFLSSGVSSASSPRQAGARLDNGALKPPRVLGDGDGY